MPALPLPASRVRLRLLAGVLAAFAVACAVWAGSAYAYAARTSGWSTVTGHVVAGGGHPDSVRWADRSGRTHVLPLQVGDTDDLPVGSVIRLRYDLAADGTARAEFASQPGARASALTVLALVAAAAAGVAWWRSRAGRRASG